MIRTSALFRTLPAAGLIAALACRDAAESTAPVRPDEVQADRAAPLPSADLDALAATVPGFGGLFLDATGAPTVYLTDLQQRDAAERAVGELMRGRGLARSGLRVLRGDFDYVQLAGWFDRASPEALALPGTVFTDLDEASNRLRIGVETGAAAARVRRALAQTNVPSSAVIVEEVEPIHFAATLRERVRPVQGALQINFGQYVCTLGFNATHSSGASFVTNSHCTNTQGGTEGTQYYQPSASVASSFIGTEASDPQYFRRGVCPQGRRCRYSDASRALYTSGVSFRRGYIYRTGAPNTGSLTIAGEFRIAGEDQRDDFVVGETVNKIGRTTGWTQGAITNTCVNTNVSGSNITQLCQTFVSAGVGGGDSGSPVFRLSGSDATLYGILWGGSTSGNSFVFSPLTNIERELGALTTVP